MDKKKKKKSSAFTNVLLVGILLIGLSLVLYPTVADWWNQFHQSRVISSYSEAVSAIDPTEYDHFFEEANAYNEYLWTMENRYIPTEEEHEMYESTLDITGTGVMGYVEIPKINVSLPIYHGTDDVVLQVAVGHIEGSSMPVGGEGTHTVLSGHRGLPSARLFTDLDQMEEGDLFIVTVLNRTFTFEVDQIRIVLPAEVDNLALEEGVEYCTLVTCTPYGVNSHRMLIRGHRVANLEGDIVVNADAKLLEPIRVAPVIALPILVVLFIVSMLTKSPRQVTTEDILNSNKKKK